MLSTIVEKIDRKWKLMYTIVDGNIDILHKRKIKIIKYEEI